LWQKKRTKVKKGEKNKEALDEAVNLRDKCLLFYFDEQYLVRERKLENFFKFKEGENFNRRNTLSILRTKI